MRPFNRRRWLLVLVLVSGLALLGSDIDKAPVITGFNSGTDSPSKDAIGNWVAGHLGGPIITQFYIPAYTAAAAMFDSPVSSPGYVRNLSVFTQAPTNGELVRLAHIVNGWSTTGIVSHGVSLFTGLAQGSYTDTISFARLETGDIYNVKALRENATVTANAGGWSAEFVPDNNVGIYFGRMNATVAAATTVYRGIVGNSTAVAGSETQVGMPIPSNLSFRRFCVVTGSAQPGTGSLVITLRRNGAPTALVITIPPSGGIGPYCDLSDTVAYTGGVDWATLEMVNNAPGAVSANVQGWSIGLIPETANVWPIFATLNAAIVSGTTHYWHVLSSEESVIELDHTTPDPVNHTVTLGNFYVYIGGAAAGAGSNTVFTVRKNLAASPVTATVVGVATGIFAGAGTVALVQGNTVSVEVAQSGGVNSGRLSGYAFSLTP